MSVRILYFLTIAFSIKNIHRFYIFSYYFTITKSVAKLQFFLL